MTFTHEQYITAVANAAIERLPVEQREPFQGYKLTYGHGSSGVRGVTYYKRWQAGEHGLRPFVEIAASTQESLVQLAGTTVHELGHVLAGYEAAHGKGWHEACDALGLRCIKAAGTSYVPAMFDPKLREYIASLPVPTDGLPTKGLSVGQLKGMLSFLAVPMLGTAGKGCMAGIGARGGKSRGVGSGSRLRLYHCSCVPPIKLRASRDDLDCTCNACKERFFKVD